jgi:hypothetical protein
MRNLLIIFTIFAIGCDIQDGEAPPRERRRHRKDDIRKVNPRDDESKPIAGEITTAQAQQVKSRAIGMRELATKFKSGEIKDIWDAQKVFLDIDKKSREDFDKIIRERMERDFKQVATDALPSNSDRLFEKLAEEFDSVLK